MLVQFLYRVSAQLGPHDSHANIIEVELTRARLRTGIIRVRSLDITHALDSGLIAEKTALHRTQVVRILLLSAALHFDAVLGGDERIVQAHLVPINRAVEERFVLVGLLVLGRLGHILIWRAHETDARLLLALLPRRSER